MANQQQIDLWFNQTYQLTGADLKTLMRKNGVTIRELKARSGFTLKYIRSKRNAAGVSLIGHSAVDWIEQITGKLPSRARAAYIRRAS